MASKDGEQMYSGRHDHKLCSCKGLSIYICSGCKQYGANVGFRCHACPDFILHEACATLSDDYVHPLYGQDPFHFRPSTLLRHHCDACGYVVKGFVFESRNAHLRLHPLCMALPPVLSYGGHKDHGLLKLITEKDGKHTCMKCNTMNSNWRYQCEKTSCGQSIDFDCARVDFLKLSEHGIARVAPPSRGKQIVETISNWVTGNVAQGTVTEVIGSGTAITGPVITATRGLFGADEDGSSPPTYGDGPPRPPLATKRPRAPPPTTGNGLVGTAARGLFGADDDGSSPPTDGDAPPRPPPPIGGNKDEGEPLGDPADGPPPLPPPTGAIKDDGDPLGDPADGPPPPPPPTGAIKDDGDPLGDQADGPPPPPPPTGGNEDDGDPLGDPADGPPPPPPPTDGNEDEGEPLGDPADGPPRLPPPTDGNENERDPLGDAADGPPRPPPPTHGDEDEGDPVEDPANGDGDGEEDEDEDEDEEEEEEDEDHDNA